MCFDYPSQVGPNGDKKGRLQIAILNASLFFFCFIFFFLIRSFTPAQAKANHRAPGEAGG